MLLRQTVHICKNHFIPVIRPKYRVLSCNKILSKWKNDLFIINKHSIQALFRLYIFYDTDWLDISVPSTYQAIAISLLSRVISGLILLPLPYISITSQPLKNFSVDQSTLARPDHSLFNFQSKLYHSLKDIEKGKFYSDFFEFRMSGRGYGGRGSMTRQSSRSGGNGNNGGNGNSSRGGGASSRGIPQNNGRTRAARPRGGGRRPGGKPKYVSQFNWYNVQPFNGNSFITFSKIARPDIIQIAIRTSHSAPNNYQSPRPVLVFSSEYPENCGDYNNLFVGTEGESDYQAFDPRDIYSLPINNVRLGDMIREFEMLHLTPEKIEINHGQRNMSVDTLVTSVSYSNFNSISILDTIHFLIKYTFCVQIYPYSLDAWIKLAFFSYYRVSVFTKQAMLISTDAVVSSISSPKIGSYDICYPPASKLATMWSKILCMRHKEDTTVTNELNKLQDELRAQIRESGCTTLGPDLPESYIFKAEELENGPICRGMIYQEPSIFNFVKDFTQTFFFE